MYLESRGFLILDRDNVEIYDYSAELLDKPRAHIKLELIQDEEGLKLIHGDRRLMLFHLTREGMLAAGFVSEALGVNIPALGNSIVARVSTGVLFRANSIAQLDFSNEASYVLLARWLEEAEVQRGKSQKI